MNAVRPWTVAELRAGTNAIFSNTCWGLACGSEPTWKIGLMGASEDETTLPASFVTVVRASDCSGVPEPVVGETSQRSDAAKNALAVEMWYLANVAAWTEK